MTVTQKPYEDEEADTKANLIWVTPDVCDYTELACITICYMD